MTKLLAETAGISTSPTFVDRMWSELMVRFDESSFWNMRVLVVACDTVDRVSLRDSLRQIGVRIVAVAPNASQLCSVAEMGKSFTHVIVNLDAFESMEDAVEALLAFRKRAPDSVVIAVSSQVAGDDLGQERSAICDATLRFPVTERRLRQGLTRGQANRADSLRSLHDMNG